jgi:DNA-binding transcriptional regulator YiaG
MELFSQATGVKLLHVPYKAAPSGWTTAAGATISDACALKADVVSARCPIELAEHTRVPECQRIMKASDRSMAAVELRAALGALNITQRRLAQLFTVNPRTVRHWGYGDRRLPRGVAIVLRLLATGVVTVEQVEAAALVSTRTNGGAKGEPPEQSALAPTLADPSRTTAEKILALAPNACRWPYNDPRHPNFYFCSRPTTAPPYCNEHRIVAHITPGPQQAPIGGQKPSSLAAWPPRTGSRAGTGRPSHDGGGPRAAPVALSV